MDYILRHFFYFEKSPILWDDKVYAIVFQEPIRVSFYFRYMRLAGARPISVSEIRANKNATQKTNFTFLKLLLCYGN